MKCLFSYPRKWKVGKTKVYTLYYHGAKWRCKKFRSAYNETWTWWIGPFYLQKAFVYVD